MIQHQHSPQPLQAPAVATGDASPDPGARGSREPRGRAARLGLIGLVGSALLFGGLVASPGAAVAVPAPLRVAAPSVAVAAPARAWDDRANTFGVRVSAERRLPAGRLVIREGSRRLGYVAVRSSRTPSATIRTGRLSAGSHRLVGLLRARSGAVVARSAVTVVQVGRGCVRTGACAPVVVVGPPKPPAPSDPTPSTPPVRPASCRTAAVWSSLEACGWAGAGNTGPADGRTPTRTVTGGMVITTDGTVVDGYRVSGGIQVRARNVTIRNSYLTDDEGGVSGSGVVNVNPGASATIVDNVIDGLNRTHACVWHEGTSVTVRGNECRNVNDGIFTWPTRTGADGSGDNFTIEDNWLHGFTTQAANGHIDGFQSVGTKHGVFRHNTVDVSQNQNSAFSVYDERKNTSDVLVQGNLMTGGGFAIYAYHADGPYTLTNVRFVDNVFSNARYGCIGYWGVWFTRGVANDGWHRSGNNVLETGADLDSTNPSVGGQLCR